MRRVNKEDVSSPRQAPDVEAPKDKATLSSPAFSSPSKASEDAMVDAAAASDHPPPGAALNNPIFLAKIIFRKVITLLLTSDEEDITQPGGIITLLKDIITGVILGVLTISILIFLDHLNIVHFQSAHNFRNAAFQLLNDPETIQTLEESSDLKFMTMNEYESKRKEIDGVSEKVKNSEDVLIKRTEELEKKRKEIDDIKEEHDRLYNNPALELDKFCGSCHWGMKSSCEQRVQFLQDTYNTRPIAAKISAMDHASCKPDK